MKSHRTWPARACARVASRRWGWGAMVAIVVVVLVAEPLFAQGTVAPGFADFGARQAVHRAIAGAAVRLAAPGCQQILSDFHDAGGVSLATNLAASRNTPVDYLLTLEFVDASESRSCRTRPIMAFTTVGSRTIRVCARAFKHWHDDDRRVGEFIVIHELLHSLGLGENPPTSDAITLRVAARCE
jgi:hypothetical protein